MQQSYAIDNRETTLVLHVKNPYEIPGFKAADALLVRFSCP
jgi:hypothetical protein